MSVLVEGSWTIALIRGVAARVRSSSGRLAGWAMSRRPVTQLVSLMSDQPVRASGVILVSAAVANLVALRFFGLEVGIGGVAWRSALLLLGMAASGCDADWDGAQQGSLILRRMRWRAPGSGQGR